MNLYNDYETNCGMANYRKLKEYQRGERQWEAIKEIGGGIVIFGLMVALIVVWGVAFGQ